MTKPIIIIGSGLAGYNLAREIRQRDKQTPMLMITRDAGDFYSKPMLSTALSMGKTPDALLSMSAEKMSAQYNMDILTHTAVDKIIPKENTLIIRPLAKTTDLIEHEPEQSQDSSLEYHSLILCLGADTQVPLLEGDALNDVLQVNDAYQYKSFHEKITNKQSITLLGAGLVGCEFANDLTQAGYKVHIVESAHFPIASLLPEKIGCELTLALEKQGARWHLGRRAKSINHHNHQYVITLDNNEQIISDVVFSAIGLKPRIDLAKQAGIHTRHGVVVDTYLRTNMSNIYAIGDCSEINGWSLPYIAPIMQCAKTLASILTNNPNPLSLPAMPVIIKTSCYPISVCRPPFVTKPEWQFEEVDGITRAYLKDQEHGLLGFILTKDAIKERMTLAQSLKHWL